MSSSRSWRRFGALSAFSIVLTLGAPAMAQITDLVKLGGYSSGLGEGAAEISAYDAPSRRLFVVNSVQASIDILDLSQPSSPKKVGAIDVTPWGAVANSVDALNDLIVVAVQADPKTDPGSAVFFDSNGSFIAAIEVGALPDMVTFSPNGKLVLVANEGEPNDDYSVDPEGSVTLIDISAGLAAATTFTFSFTDFNLGGSRAAELPKDVRIFGPNASVAMDLEPEYIALAADSTRAWVTLQEANAIAVLDLVGRRVEGIFSLGFKNHALPANTLDPSDRDESIHLGSWPVFGMYQPDSIAAFEAGGQTFLVTANEGDSRDYGGFSEEERIGDLQLDAQAFPNAAALQQDEALGRLKTTSTLGDSDGDGDYDRVFAYGARSFTIWNGDTGGQIFDSGDGIEKAVAAVGAFLDSRSDDKGPEPEGVTLGDVEGHQYAFIGLERTGGVLVYDITVPTSPELVLFRPATDGDESPEGLEFIPGSASPTGRPLLVVSHEVSGTVAVYEARTAGAGEGHCTADATTLCLNRGRFEVKATYRTPQGESGAGKAAGFTADTGYFTFFDEGNVELVVKVLDACALYQGYWVFASGLTNLEVTIEVKDTLDASSKTYSNPQFLPFQPVLDLNTFATCP